MGPLNFNILFKYDAVILLLVSLFAFEAVASTLNLKDKASLLSDAPIRDSLWSCSTPHLIISGQKYLWAWNAETNHLAKIASLQSLNSTKSSSLVDHELIPAMGTCVNHQVDGTDQNTISYEQKAFGDIWGLDGSSLWYLQEREAWQSRQIIYVAKQKLLGLSMTDSYLATWTRQAIIFIDLSLRRSVKVVTNTSHRSILSVAVSERFHAVLFDDGLIELFDLKLTKRRILRSQDVSTKSSISFDSSGRFLTVHHDKIPQIISL